MLKCVIKLWLSRRGCNGGAHEHVDIGALLEPHVSYGRRSSDVVEVSHGVTFT